MEREEWVRAQRVRATSPAGKMTADAGRDSMMLSSFFFGNGGADVDDNHSRRSAVRRGEAAPNAASHQEPCRSVMSEGKGLNAPRAARSRGSPLAALSASQGSPP